MRIFRRNANLSWKCEFCRKNANFVEKCELIGRLLRPRLVKQYWIGTWVIDDAYGNGTWAWDAGRWLEWGVNLNNRWDANIRIYADIGDYLIIPKFFGFGLSTFKNPHVQKISRFGLLIFEILVFSYKKCQNGKTV